MPVDQRIDGILSVLREELEKGSGSARELEHLQEQLRAQVRHPFLHRHAFN